MKKIVKQFDKNSDLVNVSILLTAALCIGIYLIATTSVIAKDGVTFIKYAQQFDTAPVKTMLNEFQHPGYPWLILIANKVTALLHENTSILSWIYCAQSVTLIFRLLALIVLYFIGKHLFGAKLGFWGVLILILLPNPAEYGSDALSDWPHLFFLSTGVLLLLKSATNEKWWQFGLVGLVAGAGYLVRPECAVLVGAGSLWLGLQLLSEHMMGKGRALGALGLLLAGFLAIAGPYMSLKGAVFPKKNVAQFAQCSLQEIPDENKQTESNVSYAGLFIPSNILKALGKLGNNIGETLMWFFVPALFIGIHKWFRGRKWYEPEKFFISAIIALNIPVMIWLYCKYGYMSDRHTLPLLIIPILMVPLGLQESATWLSRKFSKKADCRDAVERDERFWFTVLILIGICICIPKLFTPIRIKKQGYRAAAQWLKANTENTAIIAVPDKRISFYAERAELVYEDENIPQAQYIVKIFKKQENEPMSVNSLGKAAYKYIRKRKFDVIIYKKL